MCEHCKKSIYIMYAMYFIEVWRCDMKYMLERIKSNPNIIAAIKIHYPEHINKLEKLLILQ
jgi:hypothetical protein